MPMRTLRLARRSLRHRPADRLATRASAAWRSKRSRSAGHLDAAVLQQGARDGDWQVRWLTMRGRRRGVGLGQRRRVRRDQAGNDVMPVRWSAWSRSGPKASGQAARPSRASISSRPSRIRAPRSCWSPSTSWPRAGRSPTNVGALERLAAEPDSAGMRTGPRQVHATDGACEGRAFVNLEAGTLPMTAAGRQDVRPAAPGSDPQITAADLARLAAARARVTIRGVGSFDMTLLTVRSAGHGGAVRAHGRARRLQRPGHRRRAAHGGRPGTPAVRARSTTCGMKPVRGLTSAAPSASRFGDGSDGAGHLHRSRGQPADSIACTRCSPTC